MKIRQNSQKISNHRWTGLTGWLVRTSYLDVSVSQSVGTSDFTNLSLNWNMIALNQIETNWNS